MRGYIQCNWDIFSSFDYSFWHKLENQLQKRTQNITNMGKPMQPEWKSRKIFSSFKKSQYEEVNLMLLLPNWTSIETVPSYLILT